MTDALFQDLRYGARMLARSPGFTLVAVLTLALGIGANTAIFSVVHAVLLSPLPYPAPDRLVLLWSTFVGRGVPIGPSALPDYREWRDHVSAFEGLAGFTYNDLNLSGEGHEPERVQSARVTPNLPGVLGIAPALGRSFLPEEGQYGRHRVAILSHGLWKRRYGGDPGIVGRTIPLGGGVAYTVIGVLPEGVPFLDDVPLVDLLVPLAFPPGDVMDSRNNRFVTLVGRLRPGVDLTQARAEVATVTARMARELPENEGMGTRLVSLQESLSENSRRGLLVLLGAVVFVLLVACGNVANLLLARATVREREIAVRSSLGASQARLVRQMLVEGLPLGLLGGAAGLGLAVWGVDLLAGLLPVSLPRYNRIGIDGMVLVFAAAVSLVTVVLFGLAPAWQSSRTDVRDALGEARTVTVGRRRRRLLGVLVSSEIALALVLLVGAGLMLKSLSRLRGVEAGFSPRNVLTMSVPLGAKYQSEAAGIAFFEALFERISALPGVRAAGVSTVLPLDFGVQWGKYLSIEGRAVPASLDQVPSVRFALVSAGYFEATGVPLRKGRGISRSDTAEGQQIAVVNEALVRRFFPGENPLGRVLYMAGPESLDPEADPTLLGRHVRRTIVGVLADVKDSGLGEPASPTVFVPYTQNRGEGWFNTLALAVRTSGSPGSLAPAIVAQIRAVDPDQPVTRVATLDELVEQSVSRSRFLTLLLGIFAGVAVLLAGVGVYGVSTYSVTQRLHEFGIRIALGARSRDLTVLVLGQGFRQAAFGVAAGLAVSLALTRVIVQELYGVRATDPGTFSGVALFLTGVALLASYLPARRATRVDPAVALRSQ